MKTKTLVTINDRGQKINLFFSDGEECVVAVAGTWVDKRSAINLKVGDYVERPNGGLYRVVEVHAEEYDETETNPDHAIRDSLPENEAAAT